MQNLRDLLEHQLKDLYSAEKQLVESLPKVIDHLTHPQLKKAVQDHFQQTQTHLERLHTLCQAMDINPGSTVCKGMEGLITETMKMIAEDAPEEVKDAGLIADLQKIEHYEISGYGSAAAHAELLQLANIATILKSTLHEEKFADELLSQLAMSYINREAKGTH